MMDWLLKDCSAMVHALHLDVSFTLQRITCWLLLSRTGSSTPVSWKVSKYTFFIKDSEFSVPVKLQMYTFFYSTRVALAMLISQHIDRVRSIRPSQPMPV